METFLKLSSEQQSLSGGTGLINMYIPPNGKMSISTRKLNNEYGLTLNKSETVQKDKNCTQICIISNKPLQTNKSSRQWIFTLCG